MDQFARRAAMLAQAFEEAAPDAVLSSVDNLQSVCIDGRIDFIEVARRLNALEIEGAPTIALPVRFVSKETTRNCIVLDGVNFDEWIPPDPA